MFTGIIEAIGTVKEIRDEGSNKRLFISCSFSHELKTDQSVSHNGVCLTVVVVNTNSYEVVVIDETLKRSNLGLLKSGDMINLERSMPVGGRFDGHIVQGHVDQTAVCESVEEKDGSWNYFFSYDSNKGNLTVEKGSVTVNGVSLTVVNSSPGRFSVSIIPYTHSHTNFSMLGSGSIVNLEFDIIGKYVKAILQRQS